MKIISIIIFLTLYSSYLYAQIDLTDIEQTIDNYVETNDFDGTILVADQGKIIFHESYGFYDRGSNQVHSIKSKFMQFRPKTFF